MDLRVCEEGHQINGGQGIYVTERLGVTIRVIGVFQCLSEGGSGGGNNKGMVQVSACLSK